MFSVSLQRLHHRWAFVIIVSAIRRVCVLLFGIRFKNPPLVFKMFLEPRSVPPPRSRVSSAATSAGRHGIETINGTHTAGLPLPLPLPLPMCRTCRYMRRPLGKFSAWVVGRGSWCILNNIILIPEDFQESVQSFKDSHSPRVVNDGRQRFRTCASIGRRHTWRYSLGGAVSTKQTHGGHHGIVRSPYSVVRSPQLGKEERQQSFQRASPVLGRALVQSVQKAA